MSTVIVGMLLLVRRVRHASDAAERARQTQAEFLANVSHEIRTPMNGVLGTAELILDSELPDDLRESVEVIRESAIGQLEILNQILDQSKIESGALVLDVSSFSPRALIAQIEKTFRPTAQRGFLDLHVEMSPTVPSEVTGDEIRIRQVVTNLVNNALKFTHHGGVEIRVDAVARVGGVELRITVADTGIGIPKDKQSSICQKFRQADNSTTRRFGGTGLGLSISRQLALMMGGDIEVQSEPGKGSRFTLRVPVSAAAPFPDPVAAFESSTPGEQKYLAPAAENCGTATDAKLPELAAGDARIGESSGKGEDNAVSGADGEELPESVRGFMPKSACNPIEYTFQPIRAASERTLGADPGPERDPNTNAPTSGGALDAPITSRSTSQSVVRPANEIEPAWTPDLSPCDAAGGEAGAISDECSMDVPPCPNSSPEPQSQPQSQGPLDGMRSLLVEDNKVNQRVAMALLRKMGASVEVAGNGQEAVDRCQYKAYDTILMDCHMPVMDGYAATQAIRALGEAIRNTPIVALTAGASAQERAKALGCGMDFFLTKPINRAQLEETLVRCHKPANS